MGRDAAQPSLTPESVGGTGISPLLRLREQPADVPRPTQGVQRAWGTEYKGNVTEKSRMDGSAGGPSPKSSGFLCKLIHVAGSRERGSHGGFWETLKPRVLSVWSVMGWEGESSWDAAGRDTTQAGDLMGAIPVGIQHGGGTAYWSDLGGLSWEP